MDGRPTFDALNAQRITVLLFDARGRVELCLGAPHDPAVYRTDPALHRAASALDESGLDRFPLELGGRVGELHSLRGVWQRYLAVLPRARPGDSPSDLMSPRQYEVACYAAAGATVPEIAGHVGVSASTVRQHLKKAYQCLGVSSRLELMHAMARERDATGRLGVRTPPPARSEPVAADGTPQSTPTGPIVSAGVWAATTGEILSVGVRADTALDAPARHTVREIVQRLGVREATEARLELGDWSLYATALPGRPEHYLLLFWRAPSLRPPAWLMRSLTKRQLQVASLAAEGSTARAIGAALGLSEHTVRHHLKRAYLALGVRTRLDLNRLLEGVTSWNAEGGSLARLAGSIDGAERAHSRALQTGEADGAVAAPRDREVTERR